jgi:hypothetical protein
MYSSFQREGILGTEEWFSEDHAYLAEDDFYTPWQAST